MTEAPQTITISYADVLEIKGTPRVLDTALAEALGFSRPRDIRQLIERNLEEVESFGALAHRANHVSSGKGRLVPIREYLLTEEQALLVAILSNAPNARLVRKAMIAVFAYWRKNNLPRRDARPATDSPAPAQSLSRNDWRNRNRIRHHKLELARAVMCLDDLGVDVLAIDMNAVVSFSRFLSGRESNSVSKEA